MSLIKRMAESNLGILLFTIIPNLPLYITLINIDLTGINMTTHLPFIIVFSTSIITLSFLFIRKYLIEKEREYESYIGIVLAMNDIRHKQILSKIYGLQGENVQDTLNRIEKLGITADDKKNELIAVKQILIDGLDSKMTLDSFHGFLASFYPDYK